MDNSEEKEKAFKVDDRRRFSPEGELKPEHRGADEKPTSPQTAEPAGASEQKAASARSVRQSAEAASAAAGAGAPGYDASEAAEITFSTFIVGLSTQALFHLGEIPDPVTGEHARDLTGAQQLIDILGMLQEKSRGNLEPGEQSLIQAILFDLRMKYVEIARQTPR